MPRDLARRALFSRFVSESSEHLAYEVDDTQLPARLRPPGALTPERAFLKACSRCGHCVEACPHAAIHTLTAGAGIGQDTPVLLPDVRACHQCEGFPCARACPDGALSVPESATWKLGSVHVDASRCLPFLGPECGACADLCPDDLAALSLERCRPKISESDCVGCGLCIEACPVTPAALLFVE